MSLIIRDFMQLPLTRGSLWDFSKTSGSEFSYARHEFLPKYHFHTKTFLTTESDRRGCFNTSPP